MAKELITPKEKDYSKWYQDIIKVADLADHGPARGTMVIKPNGYAIWEAIQQELDRRIKETGHVNAYFPMFIPDSFIRKEKEHVEGFSPELAVVTIGGGEELQEPLIVRPTSETIIWYMYKKWIKSYRDLPLLINQWANVVRWEKRPRLFLRTTEFLWQEGHTAHETHEEAKEEMLKMINVYKEFAEEFLAIPVIMGRKTEVERFAGALETYTIEGMMQDYKALQMGTSHDLGQNFAKAFDVKFQTRDGKLEYVWATSWGVSTRLVGAIIMVHSDNDGLVLPPKIACHKLVIIPILKSKESDAAKVLEYSKNIKTKLQNAGLNVILDDREQYSPGYKHNDWEVKGIPLRAEIGLKEVENNTITIARRDTKQKITIGTTDIVSTVSNLLDDVQKNLFKRALDYREAHTYELSSMNEIREASEKTPGFYKVYWDGTSEDELKLKDYKLTIRCLLEADEAKPGVVYNRPTTTLAVIAKAY